MAAIIHYIGVVFYGIFASGELQPWAEPKVEEDQQMDEVGYPYIIRVQYIYNCCNLIV